MTMMRWACGVTKKDKIRSVVKGTDDKETRKRKGRPTTRWKDACKRDMNAGVGLNAVEAINRSTWRSKVTSPTGKLHEREKPRKKCLNLKEALRVTDAHFKLYSD